MTENQIDGVTGGGQSSSGFVTKSVETPILDNELKEKLIPEPSMAKKSFFQGVKDFYGANKIYFWAILIGVVVIGILSFIAFRKTPVVAPKEANVSVSVAVPQTVQSGGEAVYQITIQNNDSQKLVKQQLELTFPDGMTYESSTPNAQNLSGTLFTVPDLIPGQNVTIFLKTKVTGNVNDQKTLDIKLHYSYNNFNSEFIKAQSSTIRLTASDVTISLQGPQSTSNAQLITYSVNYQNNSQNDIQNARIKMDYPTGFVYASANPTPDLGSDTWNIGTLAKGGSGTIQIQGTFGSAGPGQSMTATAEFLILSQDGTFFTQNSSSFTTGISSLPLLVTQVLQPDNQAGVIKPGDNLTFNVSYQNNSSLAATGVNIEVDLNSKVIDLSSVKAQGGQINNSAIVWNASGIPQLASLLPNASGQLSFSLKINNPATKDSSKNLTVVSSIKIAATEYGTAFPGNQLTLKVSSPATVGTALNFNSGQLPPQVGKSTTYQVGLSLTNSSNDFSNGVLTAFIPLGSGGFVSGSVNTAEAANVQYDASTGKLTWNFGSLPANTGRFAQAKILTFNLNLNPGSSEVNRSVVLVKDISATAKDLFTGQDVPLSARDIATSDLQGQNGYANGTVQP